MRKALFGLAASLVIIGWSTGHKRSSNAIMNSSANISGNCEKAKGWKSLFDGQTTHGWHSYGKSNAGANWQVVNGTLHNNISLGKNGKRIGNGDLVTNEEYENFDLKYEWKISPKGNSGLIFLSHEDPAKYSETYLTGPEMQIVDNDGHPDGKIIKHQAGDLYDLIRSSKPSAKPVGEWNQAEIRLNHGKLDLYLNSVNVVSTTLWDDHWNQLVAHSKFKSMPDFAKYKKGRICLQDHGNEVWFRNLSIKEL